MSAGPKATVVGSYPVPEWLAAHPGEAALRDALVVVTRAQIEAGIDVISDGELGRWDFDRREPLGMVERFVLPMEGVVREPTRRQREAWRERHELSYRARPPGVVVGPLGAGRLDLKREWERVRSVTDHPLKLTLSSPYLLARTVLDEHYRDLERLTMAFADVLAEQVRGIDAAVVQVDEPNLPGSPENAALAAAAIGAVLGAADAAGGTAVHLCFGNYAGQRVQSGDYGRLAGFLDAVSAHAIVLETTRRSRDELERLASTAGARFGVGVVDVKDLQVETPDAVARRIEALAAALGPERIEAVCPDCGLRVLPREVADAKLRALVAGRDLYAGAR